MRDLKKQLPIKTEIVTANIICNSNCKHNMQMLVYYLFNFNRLIVFDVSMRKTSLQNITLF